VPGKITVIFEPLSPGVSPPSRATDHSAGYDVRACLDGRTIDRYTAASEKREESVHSGRVVIGPQERALIPLGFKARIPEGYEAQVRPRSGLALKQGLTLPNAPGTIDADYNGEWSVIVLNSSAADITISHGDRIAQVVFAPFETVDFSDGEVGRTSQRDGGFGSTGRS
jgi:dUTP pyrophosphatase